MKLALIGFVGLVVWLSVVTPVTAQGLDDNGALVKKLKEVVEKISNDLEKIGEVHTGHLDKRENKTIEVQLNVARCYTFVTVGDSGAADISLTIRAHGKEVAGDRISGSQPQVKWCSSGRVKAEVKVSMYNGSGSFALGVYAKRAETNSSAEKVGGNENDFISNRVRQLHGQFGEGRAAISPLIRGNLSTGNEKIFKVRLKAGHCYTIIGAGSPSVRNLDIILLSPNGRELNRDTSKNNFPSFSTDPCPRSGGQYRIKVNMFSGFGQFGFQVFSN